MWEWKQAEATLWMSFWQEVRGAAAIYLNRNLLRLKGDRLGHCGATGASRMRSKGWATGDQRPTASWDKTSSFLGRDETESPEISHPM